MDEEENDKKRPREEDQLAGRDPKAPASEGVSKRPTRFGPGLRGFLFTVHQRNLGLTRGECAGEPRDDCVESTDRNESEAAQPIPRLPRAGDTLVVARVHQINDTHGGCPTIGGRRAAREGGYQTESKAACQIGAL